MRMDNTISRQIREKNEIEKTIIQHAEVLFSLNGYNSTSMDELATSCEYTKRTIYRYFNCKEDLYFAVLLKGHIKLTKMIRERIQNGKTGYDRIKLVYRTFLEFHTASGPLFDLMTQIKTVSSRKNVHELPYYRRYTECLVILYKEIIPLFELASKENSIRTDIEASQLGFSAVFLLNGFFHMLSLCGDSFLQFFSLDKEQFISITENMLFQMISREKNLSKATSSSR